ncbi:MAG: hypothetical protein ABIP67_01470 [Burkholderiales bacterium]
MKTAHSGQEAKVIQQAVHWWIAKENVFQFQAHLKDCTGDAPRPTIERLLDQEVSNPPAPPKVTPRF